MCKLQLQYVNKNIQSVIEL